LILDFIFEYLLKKNNKAYFYTLLNKKLFMKKTLILFMLLFPIIGSCQATGFKNITEIKNGFVGIGTKTPDAMLTVKGSIHTQEVLVDLDGAVAPDYVFETYFTGVSSLKSDYRFLSLGEIETFIQKNHHLPKIPSAASLKEDGLSLKEMNLLLLEKIEELTLHTIKQQKQIDFLSEQIQMLKNE